jgi:hypothetical protein
VDQARAVLAELVAALEDADPGHARVDAALLAARSWLPPWVRPADRLPAVDVRVGILCTRGETVGSMACRDGTLWHCDVKTLGRVMAWRPL